LLPELNKMSLSLLSALKRYGCFALFPVLVACSNMEPGMRVALPREAGSGSVKLDGPAITPITPAIVESERAAINRAADQQVKVLFGEPKPYLIGHGDLLSILVWDHPELNIAAAGAQALSSSAAQAPAAFVVDQEGSIQFPYVGSVALAGLTESQARDRLAAKLIKSIKRPDITLRVLAYRSKKIYIDGDVKQPGNQAIDDVPMTLLEAVARAGGFLPTADESRIVVSRGGVSYLVNLPLLVKQGVDVSRLMLTPNDVVRVPSRDENKVFVLGEVNLPKALTMNNGKLTLAEALGEAGGLNQLSSSARQVYVIRNANETKPVVFNLDAASPVALALAEAFPLSPHDVVYVDASGLARYNRIISLILPSAATAATSYGQIR
jgi:polysaccharide export outer membrane protein